MSRRNQLIADRTGLATMGGKSDYFFNDPSPSLSFFSLSTRYPNVAIWYLFTCEYCVSRCGFSP